jgi:hypothetical protein
MSKKVSDLLDKARGLNNAGLVDAIEALELIADEADARNKEYGDLEELVGKVESGEDIPVIAGQTDEVVTDEAIDEADDKTAEVVAEEPAEEVTEEKGDPKKPLNVKRQNMMGIRQIGSLFYHKSDGYKNGFATAVECSEKYNSEKE